jgi:hypothetical protein
LSLLLSPLNAPIAQPQPTPTISQVCDFIPQLPPPNLTVSTRSSKLSTYPVSSPTGPSFPQPNPISSPTTLTPLPLDFRRCFKAPLPPKTTNKILSPPNNFLRSACVSPAKTTSAPYQPSYALTNLSTRRSAPQTQDSPPLSLSPCSPGKTTLPQGRASSFRFNPRHAPSPSPIRRRPSSTPSHSLPEPNYNDPTSSRPNSPVPPRPILFTLPRLVQFLALLISMPILSFSVLGLPLLLPLLLSHSAIVTICELITPRRFATPLNNKILRFIFGPYLPPPLPPQFDSPSTKPNPSSFSAGLPHFNLKSSPRSSSNSSLPPL